MKKCLRLLCLISVSLLLLSGCTKKNTKVNPTKAPGEVKKGLNDTDKGAASPRGSGELNDDESNEDDLRAKADAELKSKAAAEAQAKSESEAKAAAEAEAKAKLEQQQTSAGNSGTPTAAVPNPSAPSAVPPVTVTMVPIAPKIPIVVDPTKVNSTAPSSSTTSKPAAEPPPSERLAQPITGSIKSMPGTPSVTAPESKPPAVTSADLDAMTPQASAKEGAAAKSSTKPDATATKVTAAAVAKPAKENTAAKDTTSTCSTDATDTKSKLCTKLHDNRNGPADVSAFEKCATDDALSMLEKFKPEKKANIKDPMFLSTMVDLSVGTCRRSMNIADTIQIDISAKFAEKVLTLFPEAKTEIQTFTIVESKKLPLMEKVMLYQILNSGIEVTSKNVKYSGPLEDPKATSNKVSFLINNYSGNLKTRIYGNGKDKKNLEFAIGKTPKSEIRYIFDFSPKADGIFPLTISDGETKTEAKVKFVKGDIKTLKDGKEVTVILSQESWATVVSTQIKNQIAIHATEFTKVTPTYSLEQKEQGVRTCNINGGGITCTDPDYVSRVTVSSENLEKSIDVYLKTVAAQKTAASAKK